MVVDASLCSSSFVEEVVQQEVTQRPVVDASLSCSSGVKDAVQEELPRERTSRMEHAAKISPNRIQSKTIGNANTSMCYVLEGDVTCNSFLTDMNTAYDSYAHTDSSSINVHPISFGAPSDALECQCRSVNGSFHQGDSRLNHPGKQCMAIAYVGLANHTVSSAFSWCSEDLDKVLVLGDRLYTLLKNSDKFSSSHNYLMVPDLPKQLVFEGTLFEFKEIDVVSGFIPMVDKTIIVECQDVTILKGLQKIHDQVDLCLLTMGCYTCAIISKNGQYAVFDSHARSASGMPDGDGKSVVVYFNCLQDVYDHICNLTKKDM
ncbi:uncharacterized protein LOC144033151 [Festucalex cinctus]